MNDLAEDLATESLLERPKSALSRRVRTLTLIVVGFFWVSGGIYGNEELVSAAPPLVVFLFTALVPLVFSLPIALVTAELATAFPSEGPWDPSSAATTRTGCGSRTCSTRRSTR